MRKNRVIIVIERTIGTDKIEYISGEIENSGEENCKLSEERGSVYGIAVKLETLEVADIFTKIKNTNKQLDAAEWKTIGDNYYPLYWGKDINMGIRLYAHTKTMKSTGTLQLNNSKYKCLQGKEVIYGAIPCINYEKHEDTLHKQYPDILKTSKGKGDDQFAISDVCVDE